MKIKLTRASVRDQERALHRETGLTGDHHAIPQTRFKVNAFVYP